MTDNISIHECPHCGAPLKIPVRHERYFKCEFCGTTLEDKATPVEQNTGTFKIFISTSDMPEAPVYSIVRDANTGAAATVSPAAARKVGVVIAIVVGVTLLGALLAFIVPILLTAGIFGAVALEVSQQGDPVSAFETAGLEIWSVGPSVLVPSDNDSSPDVLAAASFSDDTQRVYYIDFESQPALRWISPPLVDATYVYNEFIVDQTAVYYSYGTEIIAFNRQSGEQLWDTTLSDEIQFSICEDCFLEIGTRIVALTADGQLQALDRQTGSPAWSVRLTESPRQIIEYGGSPAVLDRVDGEIVLEIFDPLDGSRSGRLAPECPNEIFTNDPQRPYIYDRIWVSPDRASFFIPMGAYDPGCLQRWTPDGTSPVWQTSVPTEAVRSVDEADTLFSQETIFVAADHTIYTFRISDGAFGEAYTNSDYTFQPIAAVENILLLQADRTRGSARQEIWVLDTTSGEVLWTIVPEADNRLSDGSDVAYTTGLWWAGLNGETASLLEIYGEGLPARLQTFDLRSGAEQKETQMNLAEQDFSIWVSLLGARANEVWLMVDDRVVVIGLRDGVVLRTWP